MATYTTLQNERTGELKKIKVGWSWTLFFFTGFLGIPLFMRSLYVWGFIAFALCLFFTVIEFAATDEYIAQAADIFDEISICVMAFTFAIKGNAMTAKNYLENGWMFAYPEDSDTEYAKQRWSLA